MINDSSNSTRYKRRTESKHILEYIHGGEEGAVYGAWDILVRYASKELMEKFIISYKRGKFIEKLYGKFANLDEKSESTMKQALATKYMSHLSRRKYNFICKIQKSIFDPDTQTWANKNISYGDYKINLRTVTVSHGAIEKFVNNLDIGEIHIIPGYSGVARTVSALTTMIIDLQIRVPSLNKSLIWFKNNENHFVVEFSDDGAPESKETTMSIGSLTLWNLGNKVRSREYHYPLHTISTSEKDIICSNLWMQHTEEMALIENNVLHMNGDKVTVEFQPSSDQAWQVWANNVLPNSATYPSPFANVHKGDLQKIGGSIGPNKENTWQPPTIASRKQELEALTNFRKTLPKNMSTETQHKKELEYMANNGIRQLGEPRVGIFADRQRPEPMHLEINNWQHMLDLLYKEAVRRNCFDDFIDILRSPQTKPKNGKVGCGLKFLSSQIVEHFSKESQRMKKLQIRIIGAQAIALARYSYRLVDTLILKEEGPAQEIKRLALAKMCQYLRDIGMEINKVYVETSYVEQVNELCQTYFNMFALFFPESCQITVWTLGYVVPYHARILYNQYEIGYGILTMQGKEAKHSSIKQELRYGTNRSLSEDKNGKWFQIMRSSYIRTFYLPYHYPITTGYHSHFQSRVPPMDESSETFCTCSRVIEADMQICKVCKDAMDMTDGAKEGMLTVQCIKSLKPIECRICQERFPDFVTCDSHIRSVHEKSQTNSRKIIPAILSVNELKKQLKLRNKSVSGNKDVLKTRLEGAISSDF